MSRAGAEASDLSVGRKGADQGRCAAHQRNGAHQHGPAAPAIAEDGQKNSAPIGRAMKADGVGGKSRPNSAITGDSLGKNKVLKTRAVREGP